MPTAAIPAAPPAVETEAVSRLVTQLAVEDRKGPMAGIAEHAIGLPDPADIAGSETPAESRARALGIGVASYYGKAFAGRPTASGERFNPGQMTAAHRTLPFGSMVRVTNPSNGKSVVVRINDRGPFVRGRTIDLSRAAAEEIGLVRRGHGQVELALLQ